MPAPPPIPIGPARVSGAEGRAEEEAAVLRELGLGGQEPSGWEAVAARKPAGALHFAGPSPKSSTALPGAASDAGSSPYCSCSPRVRWVLLVILGATIWLLSTSSFLDSGSSEDPLEANVEAPPVPPTAGPTPVAGQEASTLPPSPSLRAATGAEEAKPSQPAAVQQQPPPPPAAQAPFVPFTDHSHYLEATRHKNMIPVVQRRWRKPRDRSEAFFQMFDIGGAMYNSILSRGERFVQDVFHDVLDKGCRKNMTPAEAWAQAVVIDVGANVGFYGLLALAHGCAVIFVEPQPECNDLIARSIRASRFDKRKVFMVQQPLGGRDLAGKFLEVRPENHCDSRFPVANLEQHSDAYGSSQKRHGSVPFLQVEDMLKSAGLSPQSKVLLLKLDVEGFELNILQALIPTLSAWHVENLVVEVTPAWWEHTGFKLKQGALLLEEVASLGYAGRTIAQTFDSPAAFSYWILHGHVSQDHVWLIKEDPEPTKPPDDD